MSGGGAGKVYFVLYLAVVLELLIIIVERDEAEEHLHAKQKEAMQIVQSILSQMQAGAGTEGVNTRPQDEITITPPGVDLKKVMGADIKPWRKYIIEVGVTDVSADAKQHTDEGESVKEFHERLRKLVKLANVEEFEYQIFYNNSDDPDSPPAFPSDDYIEEQGWNFDEMATGQVITTAGESESWKYLGMRKLTLDLEKTYDNVNKDKPSEDRMNPVYITSNQGEKTFAPDRHPEDSVFYYSLLESIRAATGESHADASVEDDGVHHDMIKRSFVVYFQPPAEQGWYKLRFHSRTNKILGLTANAKVDELDKDETVNIGTVQLKIEQLKKVKKGLEIELDRFGLPTEEEMKEAEAGFIEKRMETVMKKAREEGEDFSENKTKITLYGYILRLLTPGMSKYFKPNQGAIDFNVRVITPKPDMPEPKIIMFSEDYNVFDKARLNFKFDVDPYKEGQSQITGYVYNKGDEGGSPVGKVDFKLVENQAEARSQQFIGTVDRILEAAGGGPREYTLKMVHALGTEENSIVKDLTVFPSIVQNDVDNLQQRISAYAEYGQFLVFNHIPPSGNKILPEQFGFYFSTDADPQPRGLIKGYTAEVADKLYFPAEAKTAKFKLVWIDPITEDEIDIVPEKSFEIIQAAPSAPNLSNIQTFEYGEDDYIDLEVTGIKMDPSSISTGAEGAKAKVQVTGKVTSVDVTSGYTADGDPEISMDPEGRVTIKLSIVGEPDEDGFAIGTVKVKLFFTATNPVNGKVSANTVKTIPIRVNFEFPEE